IEPGRIERVADVVKGVDYAGRLPLGVAVEPVADDLDEAHQRLVAQHLFDQVMIDAKQIEKLRQIRRVPFAAQISLGYSDVATPEEPRCKAVIVKPHGRRRARLDPAEPQGAAVGKCYVQGTASELCAES